MNQHHSAIRKIDPTRGATLGDGSPNDQDRIEIGPTQLAMREWEGCGSDPAQSCEYAQLSPCAIDATYCRSGLWRSVDV